MDEKIHYSLGSDSYAFSAIDHDQDDLGNSWSSVTAGIGRQILDSGHFRLDLDLGAGYRIEKLRQTGPDGAEPIARFGLRFTAQGADSRWQLRQDLVIETERSSTASESRTTWSYSLNPKLTLELMAAARKRSNMSGDPLEVPKRAAFTLNYAF